jgi:uncharacterized cupin superfamily protein
LFHPEKGDTVDIKAGHAVYFDNCNYNESDGNWRLLETVRKAYLTYKALVKHQ